jgi:hypothetical protein
VFRRAKVGIGEIARETTIGTKNVDMSNGKRSERQNDRNPKGSSKKK